MSLFFSNKLVRLLLSVSVSVWLAGGCLFGCSSGVMAADVLESNDPVPTVEAGDSCHAVRAHDCCASKASKKQVARKSAPAPEGVSSFVPVPRGTMKDCPLIMNATAATSKSSTHSQDPASGPIAILPRLEKQTQLVDSVPVVQFLPNRGPTHLRCCVFLI